MFRQTLTETDREAGTEKDSGREANRQMTQRQRDRVTARERESK